MNLVLASKSPRRSEILQRAGLPFTVRVSDVPEFPAEGESPQDYVRRLARSKASAIERHDAEIVLGADTVVVLEGQILEKPANSEHARTMLRALSGRNHQVVTGICLIDSNGIAVDHATTIVHFVPMSASEIDSYVASGEPMDKAGAYGIQGLASKWIDRIEGDYLNVVGLPLALVYQHLKQRRLISAL